MGKIVTWRYEGSPSKDNGERLIVEREPAANDTGENEVSVTVGAKTVWLTNEQAKELKYVLSALFEADRQV